MAQVTLDVVVNSGKALSQIKKLSSEIQKSLDKSGTMTTQATANVNKLASSFGSLSNMIGRTLTRIALYSTIGTMLRRAIVDIGAMLMSNEQFAQSIERLTASFYMLAVPIYEVVMPILRALINTLSEVVTKIAIFLYSLGGKTAAQLSANAKVLKKNTEAYKASTKAKKANAKAQKDLNKEIAAFDELMILQEKKKDAANGGVGGGGGVGGYEPPEEQSQEYLSRLAVFGQIAGDALVGLGLIMLMSGNVATGLAMIAAGYVVDKTTEDQAKEKLGEAEKRKLSTIGTITGLALMGLGIILLFVPSVWKIGLAMILVGARRLYKALELADFPEDMTKKVENILDIVGKVAFVLGVILLFVPGAWTYGFRLLAVGVTAIATELQLQGKDLKTALETFVSTYWKELYAIAALMVVVGIVLLFCQQWGYGFALIISGIAAVAGTAYLHGDNLLSALKTFADNYASELHTAELLMVVVGVVLLFCHQWKYGLSLILLGIATFATQEALSGGSLKGGLEKVAKDLWADLTLIGTLMIVIGIVFLFAQQWVIGLGLLLGGVAIRVLQDQYQGSLDSTELKLALAEQAAGVAGTIITLSAFLAVIGVILLFVPGTQAIGLGMLAAGIGGIWMGAKLNLDSSKIQKDMEVELGKVKKVTSQGVDDINSELDRIGKTKTTSSGTTYVEISSTPKVKAHHANGTVVPPNRPYLAWLGDNTEEPEVVSPLSTMRQAVKEAVAEMGGGFGSGNTTVVLEIDGREFGRAVVEQGGLETRRIGTSLVVV